jgi:hypothetical protein
MKLAELVAQYAVFRKSLGEDFESDTRVLQSFSRSIGAEADITDCCGSSKAFSTAADQSRTRTEAYDPSWLLPLRPEPRAHCRIALACDNSETTRALRGVYLFA